jgi:hypothetical protein
MKVETLIRDIRDRGGDLALDGEAVVIHFKDPLPDELVGKARQHKTEIASYLRSHEVAHPDIASACEGERIDSVAGGRVSDCGVSPADAEPGPVDRGVEAPQTRAPATPTGGRATDVSVPPGHGMAQDTPSTPEGPIPWHDATPDERAEIKTALFEGLPVQILSQVLCEIVWWVKDDAVAQRLRGGEFVKQGYPPYRGAVIYAWSELLAVIGFLPDALKNLHEFKKAFDARISKPRVICSGCRHLAAPYRHCLVRKDIRIANPDNPIECDSYRPR